MYEDEYTHYLLIDSSIDITRANVNLNAKDSSICSRIERIKLTDLTEINKFASSMLT